MEDGDSQSLVSWLVHDTLRFTHWELLELLILDGGIGMTQIKVVAHFNCTNLVLSLVAFNCST